MRVITEIPISKTHSISLCSLGCLCILIMGLITILIPFFLVFTQGFFKNTSEMYQQFSISSTNQFYIFATSSLTSTSFTNLISSNTVNSNLMISNVKISSQDINADSKPETFTFSANILQPSNKTSQLTSLQVLLFFNATSSLLNTTAFTFHEFHGSSISSALSTGHLTLAQNQLINTTIPNTNYSSNPFVSNYYNLDDTLDSYYQQATFFEKTSTEFVVNEGVQEAKIKIVLNLKNQQKMIVASGIFEQIQWSWCYYFPVLVVLGYVGKGLVDLMVKYGVIESRIRRY